MQFRNLRADELDVRVAQTIDGAKWKGASLLIYKDARCDMNILDETVGAERWQNKFYDCKGILFCSLGIKIDDEWVWKDDAGVESNTEAEKGNASDARKRAGFAWGIGRALYTSPKIFAECELEKNEKTGKMQPKSTLRWTVDKIEYSKDGKEITALSIRAWDRKKDLGVVFNWNKE